MSIVATRKTIRFNPDPKRVIARFFMPGMADRALSIFSRVASLPEHQARQIIEEVLRRFAVRHRNMSRLLKANYERARDVAATAGDPPQRLSVDKKLLIGSYFTMEYSIESAAFYNPSIVPDPNQGLLPPGELRVILSFRATGEGHVSSIVFRGGTLDSNCDLTLDPPGTLVDRPETVRRHVYRKADFTAKLTEMRLHKDVMAEIIDRLDDTFSYGQLRASIEQTRRRRDLSYSRQKVIDSIGWLADSHYEVTFSRDTGLGERVIFPVSETESNGLEDARFVRFSDESETTYYATYTAYNGYAILPKLMVTEDFCHFTIRPLHGQHAQNKGMSLFPRKLDGKYAMIGRCDGVNLYLLRSTDVHFWPDAVLIEGPKYPWEFVQIGNSGSPIETPEGWLLITHGVGPLRTYCLGATLLDLDDPSVVIGRTTEPILLPNADEREGYVPNVVYSCGSIVHNGQLVIPYAMADCASSVATIPLSDLTRELRM